MARGQYDVQAATAVEVALPGPSAQLTITSQPSGAPVTVNKASAGWTPLHLNRPAFEQYKVVVSPSGCKPLQRAVYLKPPGVSVSLSCPAGQSSRPKK